MPSMFGFFSPGTGAAPMVSLPYLAVSSGKILRDCLVWKIHGLVFTGFGIPVISYFAHDLLLFLVDMRLHAIHFTAILGLLDS
jgi:hypothetical protein